MCSKGNVRTKLTPNFLPKYHEKLTFSQRNSIVFYTSIFDTEVQVSLLILILYKLSDNSSSPIFHPYPLMCISIESTESTVPFYSKLIY